MGERYIAMPEFLKPELPKKVATAKQHRRPSVRGAKEHSKVEEKFVVRAKMPNTLAYWSDLLLAKAAFQSFNVSLDLRLSKSWITFCRGLAVLTNWQDNFRLTCLSAMQQRAKNDVPRQPKKVHWDYLLEEAEWLRRDFREERVWKLNEAKKRARECVKGWMLRAKERGHFVEDGEVTGSELGYRRRGERQVDVEWGGDFAVRTRVADEDAGGDVLGKRTWNAVGEGDEDGRERLKRPRMLRRFSCRVDDSI